MQLFLLRLVLVFGLPWNAILWFIFLRPKRNQMMFHMEDAFGIVYYTIYGVALNILIGVLCLLA
jgi:hypothetical protein